MTIKIQSEIKGKIKGEVAPALRGVGMPG